MGLETVTYLPELTQTNPIGASDPKSEGDDHIRLIKKALLNTFGAFTGTAGTPKSVTLTEDQINDASQKSANETITGTRLYTQKITTDGSTMTRAGFNIPSGTAPTSPSQGDIWVTTADILARINGVSVSLIDGPVLPFVTKHKTGDTVRTTDASLTDDPHLAGWTLVAAAYYKLTGFIVCNVGASTAPDFAFAFQTSQTFQDQRGNYTAISDGSVVQQDNIQITNSTNIAMASNARTGVEFHYFIKTHASNAATLDFQWAQGTSSGFATTLEDGSWITVEKIS